MKEKEVTEFGNVLKDALDNKPLVWKTKAGKEIPLNEMTEAEFQKAWSHTYEMLYNTSKFTPGKYQVKKNIKFLADKCNAELLLRYLLHDLNGEIFKTKIDVLTFINARKDTAGVTNSDFVTALFTGLPNEFENVTVSNLVDACLDRLGIVNRKMISDKFILAQGIWLTDAEKEELTEKDEKGHLRPWLDVIKERCLLTNVKLRIDPKGFSFHEFRALIHLEALQKISSLPTETLTLLRDKVFVLLDSDTDYYIEKWTTLKAELEKVAAEKKYVIKKNTNDN